MSHVFARLFASSRAAKLRSAFILCLALLAAACSGRTQPVVGPTGTTPSTPTPSVTTASPSPAATGQQALVASLPVSCHKAVPAATASIAFAADGRAWAVAPDGTGLTCLFKVTDPGLFEWGPRADRVILSGLQVRGVGSDATRPVGSIEPAEASWGRPNGLAIAFVDPAATKLKKAIVGSSEIQDVSPFDNVTYQTVEYHPSGLALGFVLTDSDGSSIWMSSNTGTDPKRLVWSKEGTIFGPIAFGSDGNLLYYGAHPANGTYMLAQLDLGLGVISNDRWVGAQNILRVVPGMAGAGIDTGTGCDDRQAVFSDLSGTAGTPLLAGAAEPTSIVGWVDQDTALVAEGGCSGPVNLWTSNTAIGGTVQLLAQGVDRAAVRVPDPLPTPALPDIGVNEGAA